MTNKINDQKETRIRMGEIIKEARLKKDLTQSELGKMLGKSDNVVTNWEKGTNSPDVENIQRLCAILSIPVNDMFGGQDNELPHIKISGDEQRLVYSWRNLSHKNQLKLTGVIEFMFREECAISEDQDGSIKRAQG